MNPWTMAQWYAEGHTADDLEPKLAVYRFDTEEEAHIDVLASYIATFADEHHPQLFVDILDPDEDMTTRPELLRKLRKEANRT